MSKNFGFTPGNLKTAMKSAGATSRDLWYVPIGKLVVREGFNVREHNASYDAHVRTLADSIKANGFYPDEPLGVFIDGDEVVIHGGHCRFAATQLAISEGADIKELPCVSVPRGTSAEDLTVALHTTNSGKPLTPFELGVVCVRLVKYGWDEKQIASRLGFTPTYVSDLLFLQECPKEVRTLVQEDKVSAGMAIAAVRKHGAEAAAALDKAVAKAESKGKAKATGKHMDEAVFDRKKELKKAAPDLLEALYWVKDDPNYLKLCEATRDRLDKVSAPFPEEPVDG